MKRERPSQLINRFIKNEGPWEKEDLSNAVFWVKIVLSLALGIATGLLKLTGAIGNVAYIICVPLSVHMYVSSVMGIDITELFKSASGVMFEGSFPSYAAFVLSWSLIHTFFYELSQKK